MKPTRRDFSKARPAQGEQAGLARALSKLGHCSRSRAWEIIQAGDVTVNGSVCRDPERRVTLGRDRLAVQGRPVVAQARVYLMLNKPRGLVTTAADERGRGTVYQCLEDRNLPFISPVGRLDQASEGLLLFTNDTEWAARITDPATHLDKTYHVQIDCVADDTLLRRLADGVEADGGILAAKSARRLREGERNSWLEIVLDEGRNRQIRRLLEALGIAVLRLVRVSIGTLQLGDLSKGESRALTIAEVAALRSAPSPRSGPAIRRGRGVEAERLESASDSDSSPRPQPVEDPVARPPLVGGKGAVASESKLRLRVTATAETIVRSRHPWLFSDSVREQNREGRPGELAVIYDRKDRFLAIGLYDPLSPIRVRLLHTGKPCRLDDAWWRQRLDHALARRDGLFDDATTGFRWINGESDGWPGLVVDGYGKTLVMKLYTAAWLPRWRDVARALCEARQPERLVLRLSRNIQEIAATEFSTTDGQVLAFNPATGALESSSWAADAGGTVTFLETGLRFEANVVSGQKTGFFLDQRENRRRVGALAAGREVLNAFSFSGGFSLYAAAGGATSVTDLDISAHALASARRNFALNEANSAVAGCRHETAQGDAFAWLEQERARQFDLVVLDPPSLAKREADRAGAIQAYAKLAANGMRRLRQGGILVAASCSAHVSAEEFFGAVRGAAAAGVRRFVEMETTGHPPDHPATFPEARYLKCVYLRFP